MLRELRHRAEQGMVRAAAATLGRCPEPVADRAGSFVGRVAGSVLRIRRAEVDDNLRHAFPEEPDSWRRAVAVASYRHLGREAAILLGAGRRRADRLAARIRTEGLEELRDALRAGRGAVVVTGHLGNWEVGGLALARAGAPVHAVVKPLANARADRYLSGLRARLGLGLVPTADASRLVPRLLRQGCVVAFVADQDAGERGLFVPFLGREASTGRGPAVLSLRTGAPLFFGASVAHAAPPAPTVYRVAIRRIEAERSGHLARDVRTLTRAHTRVLEEVVRQHPEQYFWHHRRWKSRPVPAGQEQPPEAPV